ncbi:hypothetical protein FXW78_21970 [Rhodococcus opacus]|nr:hypothetical protein [Rhodococcus opacus]
MHETGHDPYQTLALTGVFARSEASRNRVAKQCRKTLHGHFRHMLIGYARVSSRPNSDHEVDARRRGDGVLVITRLERLGWEIRDQKHYLRRVPVEHGRAPMVGELRLELARLPLADFDDLHSCRWEHQDQKDEADHSGGVRFFARD